MSSLKKYLFKSERLGFRTWLDEDIAPLSSINSNKNVMEFFPSVQNEEQTIDFIKRMNKLFSEKSYCYFAVDKLSDNSLIGFIGLNDQTFESKFTPAVDIGWRIDESEWDKGYATEGALASLDYAFQKLNIKRIIAIAPAVNIKSEKIMQKIGMNKAGELEHPKLTDHNTLKKCVVYDIKSTTYFLQR